MDEAFPRAPGHVRDKGVGVGGGDFGDGEELVLVERVTGACGERGGAVAVDGEGDAVGGEGGWEEVEWGGGDGGRVDGGGGRDGEGEGGGCDGGVRIVGGCHYVGGMVKGCNWEGRDVLVVQ